MYSVTDIEDFKSTIIDLANFESITNNVFSNPGDNYLHISTNYIVMLEFDLSKLCVYDILTSKHHTMCLPDKILGDYNLLDAECTHIIDNTFVLLLNHDRHDHEPSSIYQINLLELTCVKLNIRMYSISMSGFDFPPAYDGQHLYYINYEYHGHGYTACDGLYKINIHDGCDTRLIDFDDINSMGKDHCELYDTKLYYNNLNHQLYLRWSDGMWSLDLENNSITLFNWSPKIEKSMDNDVKESFECSTNIIYFDKFRHPLDIHNHRNIFLEHIDPNNKYKTVSDHNGIVITETTDRTVNVYRYEFQKFKSAKF